MTDTLLSELHTDLCKVRRDSVDNLAKDVSRDAKVVELTKTDFGKKILSLTTLMNKYGDPGYQSEALDVILSSPIYARLDEEAEKDDGLDYTDHLVKQLLKWFKEDFFTWVNKPKCPQCGNEEQDQIQGIQAWAPYTKEHFEGQAAVVERYKCLKCKTTIEFPRYNNPATLLKTRCGRCGEWDNCFILLMKSLGLKVRYLWNAEDHVWCEYYSENLQRWVHLDCCENAFDNPLLYNRGWAKKMSYVFAIADHYIRDVTDKYIDKELDRALPRDKMSETDLQKVLAAIDLSLFAKISDESTLLEATSDLIHDYRNMTGTNALAPTKTGPMLPRQSGSAQWTADRNENGL